MATNKLIKRIDLLTSTQMDKDALATKARDVLAAEVAKDNKRNYISCVYDVFNNKLFLALDKGIQQQYNYDTDFLEIKLTDTTTGGGDGTGGGGIIDPGTNEIIKEFREKIIQEIIKELGTNNTELVIKLKETILKSDEFKETIKEILEGKDTLSQEIINKIKDLVINSTEFREKVLALTPEIILGIETGASIDDNVVVTDKTWSSSKIDSEIKKNIGQGGGGTTVECNCIDDTAPKTDKTFSSQKITDLIGQGGGGGNTNIIDDNTKAADKTWSSNKIDAEIKGKTEINDTSSSTNSTYSSSKINQLIAAGGGGGGGTFVLTKEMIIDKLTYTPANEKVTDNHEKRITLLESNAGFRPGGSGNTGSSGNATTTGKYRVINIDTDYTLTQADLMGNTIIRGTKAGNQNITIPAPDGVVTTDNSTINPGPFGGAGINSLYALITSKYTRLSIAKYKEEHTDLAYGTTVTLTFTQWDTWFPTWKKDSASLIKTNGENNLNRDRDYAVSIGQWIPGTSDTFYAEALNIVKNKTLEEIETWITESVTQNKFVPLTFTYKPSTVSGASAGSVVTIRKVDDTENTVLTLLPANGVTFNPADSTVLRRSGSSAVLVYIGDGVFDIFNELP